jgi:hypothetical protein
VATQGIDVRQTTGRIAFRCLLLDSAGAIVTSGTTNLKLYELQDDGTLHSYDWNDNTFKSTALTTENQTMTHRQGNNGSTNTGIWTVNLTTLSDFNSGGIYFAHVSNTNATPDVQVREFQFGSAQGDLTVTSARLNTNANAISESTDAADRLEAALTTANGIDINLGQSTGTPGANTVGEGLRNAHEGIPNAAAGGNAGLPTVDANNRVAGIQGSRFNTLDDQGSTILVSTTVAAGSTASIIRLASVPGGDQDGDYDGALIIVRDISDSNRPCFRSISSYATANNACTLDEDLDFSPSTGDLVEVHASTASDLMAEVQKLTVGFGTSSPDRLVDHLRAMMSKGASAPSSGVGTYSPATDSLEILGEGVVAMEGAGFETGTDSLKEIRDAIDTLVAPSVVSSSALSGSGFLSNLVSLIRKATDEPDTDPKWTDADVVKVAQTAFDEVLQDCNANTDHPVGIRHTITLVDGTQDYILPPTVGQVLRVAKINSSSGLPEWESWPGGYMDPTQSGWRIEGNTLRLLRDWDLSNDLEILYIPNSVALMHKATADAVTSTTVTFPSSVTDGTLDTRPNAYVGYFVRILSSTQGVIEERLVTAYNVTTRVATINKAWDTTPTGTVVYEVVPLFDRLMESIVALRGAMDILAQEGNTKRLAAITQSYQLKLRALRLQLSRKQARFPHHMDGDTWDNLTRYGFQGGLDY